MSKSIYTDANPNYTIYVILLNKPNKKQLTYILVRVKPTKRDVVIQRVNPHIFEYDAIYEALKHTEDGEKIEIFSDSKGAVNDLTSMKPRPLKTAIRHRASSIKKLIERKSLRVKFTWVPRQQNLAGKILEWWTA